MARPTKYTSERAQTAVDAIKLGATYDLAAAAAGISYETFNEWRKRFSEFSEAINVAEGAAVVTWLTRIEAAATDGVWQAAAWKLERRYPQHYGKQVIEQQHTGKDGGALLIQTVRIHQPPVDVALES